MTFDLRATPYDHADALLMTELVQEVYIERYGSPDVAPIDASHFELPGGYFVIAYVEGTPAAMGGWRRHDESDAEIKRMYVRDGYRGRGLARTVLAHLEETARTHGIARTILETGLMQPEAIAVYRSSGYTDIPAFGYYADSGHSVHLGKRLDGRGPEGADKPSSQRGSCH